MTWASVERVYLYLCDDCKTVHPGEERPPVMWCGHCDNKFVKERTSQCQRCYHLAFEAAPHTCPNGCAAEQARFEAVRDSEGHYYMEVYSLEPTWNTQGDLRVVADPDAVRDSRDDGLTSGEVIEPINIDFDLDNPEPVRLEIELELPDDLPDDLDPLEL